MPLHLPRYSTLHAALCLHCVCTPHFHTHLLIPIPSSFPDIYAHIYMHLQISGFQQHTSLLSTSPPCHLKSVIFTLLDSCSQWNASTLARPLMNFSKYTLKAWSVRTAPDSFPSVPTVYLSLAPGWTHSSKNFQERNFNHGLRVCETLERGWCN